MTKTTKEKVKTQIKGEIKKYHNMETELLSLQNKLARNKEFQQFLKLQNAVNDKAKEVWSGVEEKMVEHDIKSIDADWVKLTIVEKPKIEVVGDIDPKFMKEVPDTKKINAYIKETEEVPEGIKKSTSRYLRKTFRPVVS